MNVLLRVEVDVIVHLIVLLKVGVDVILMIVIQKVGVDVIQMIVIQKVEVVIVIQKVAVVIVIVIMMMKRMKDHLIQNDPDITEVNKMNRKGIIHNLFFYLLVVYY